MKKIYQWMLAGTLAASLIYLFSRFYIIAKHVYHISYGHYLYKIGRYFLVAVISTVLIYLATQGIHSTTLLSLGVKIVCVVILAAIIPLGFLVSTEELHFVIDTMLPEKFRKFFSRYLIWFAMAVLLIAVAVWGNYEN